MCLCVVVAVWGVVCERAPVRNRVHLFWMTGLISVQSVLVRDFRALVRDSPNVSLSVSRTRVMQGKGRSDPALRNIKPGAILHRACFGLSFAASLSHP